MKRYFVLLLAMAALHTSQARERQCFDADWRFILADSTQMANADYNDSHWRKLSLPHDWAIEGDFYAGNPSGAGGERCLEAWDGTEKSLVFPRRLL